MCADVQGALGSSNEILRCAAGEALGRIVQVVGENKFIADMAQYSFDRLITNIVLLLLKLSEIVCCLSFMFYIVIDQLWHSTP